MPALLPHQELQRNVLGILGSGRVSSSALRHRGEECACGAYRRSVRLRGKPHFGAAAVRRQQSCYSGCQQMRSFAQGDQLEQAAQLGAAARQGTRPEDGGNRAVQRQARTGLRPAAGCGFIAARPARRLCGRRNQCRQVHPDQPADFGLQRSGAGADNLTLSRHYAGQRQNPAG
ncbi:hypothetical protein D3C71_1578840 [compost metagenome]